MVPMYDMPDGRILTLRDPAQPELGWIALTQMDLWMIENVVHPDAHEQVCNAIALRDFDPTQ